MNGVKLRLTISITPCCGEDDKALARTSCGPYFSLLLPMFDKTKLGKWGPKILVAAFLVALGAVCASKIDLQQARAWIEGVNGLWFFVLLAVLPVLGFPVSVLQVLAGVKFGFWAGVAVTAGAITCNLLGVHWVGSGFLKQRVKGLLSRTRFRLPEVPEGEHRFLGLLVPLLPGSYTLKNYLMVLGGVSLRTLLCICLPIYAVRASSGIFLGGISGNLTPWLIALLVAGKIVGVLLTVWVIRRLRRRI